MARLFSRKKFSSYLGEERAILDIYTEYIPNPTPTPTPTPSMTPTLTNTPTPSSTLTPTPTLTNTSTPTNTPTLTPTQTSGIYSALIKSGSTQSQACGSSSTFLVYSNQPFLTGGQKLYLDSGLTTQLTNSAPTYSYNGQIFLISPFPPNDIYGITNCPTPTPTPTKTATPTPTLTPTPTTPPFDVDAQTYLDNVIGSGGTIDATASAATNTLFTELKSNGLYSKLRVMYPILGNTLGGFAINAVSPGYKNVIWYNNPTASPLGVQYDGVSQYGDTGWAALTDTTIYSAGTIGYFCNIINTSAYGGEMMAVGGGGNNRWGAFGGESEWYSDWGLNGLYARVSTSLYSGGTIICRSSLPNLQDVWFNGTLLGSGSGADRAGAAFFANTIQLGRREDGYYSNGRYGFYFIADFMDDGEVVLMNNIINNFQTTLGRNI